MGKRAPKDSEPPSIRALRLRVDYYLKLADEQMKLGEDGSRTKIEKYLGLAADAGKELAPYEQGKAQPGEGDEPKKHYIMRLGVAEFKDKDEWLFYYKVTLEKHPELFAAAESLNEKMLKADHWKSTEEDHIKKWWEAVKSGRNPNKDSVH